ncbi:MAG: AAA family ATPase [Thermodesulfobacteria bacterium]|nr:AAA family ATPase [Thermodesulfobacteriota bacterium]
MYIKFYGLQKKPFSLSPDPDCLFMSPKHEKIYVHLKYAIFENKNFVVITGEIGSGKTTLINFLLRQIKEPYKVVYIRNTLVSPTQFLKLICQDLNIPVEGLDKPKILSALRDYLLKEYRTNRRIILIIDEAQNLSFQTLEEIRLISNLETEKEPLWQIILVGQPELKKKLQHPSLKQFVQRITVYCHLEPLNKEETFEYIKHRLRIAGAKNLDIFTKDAMEAIYRYSKGIPRLINILCDTALVYGFADELSFIDEKVVESVVEDRKKEGLFFEKEETEEVVSHPKQLPTSSISNTSVEELKKQITHLENRLNSVETIVKNFSEQLEVYKALQQDLRNLVEVLVKYFEKKS